MKIHIAVITAAFLITIDVLAEIVDSDTLKKKRISPIRFRMIGGDNASIEAFPYQASLRLGNYPICGGSIINSRWILTAAHCITRYRDHDLRVVVGTDRLDISGDFYQSIKLVVHPDYSEQTLLHDVGLIMVNMSISFNKRVQPVSLQTEIVEEDSSGLAVVSGWGKNKNTDMFTDYPEQLQYLEAHIIKRRLCQKLFEQNDMEHKICLLKDLGKGLCNGDSGNPLVINGVQIGVASVIYGGVGDKFPCASTTPDVYTRVSTHFQWIQEICGDTLKKSPE